MRALTCLGRYPLGVAALRRLPSVRFGREDRHLGVVLGQTVEEQSTRRGLVEGLANFLWSEFG